jgi:hypothetical protein
MEHKLWVIGNQVQYKKMKVKIYIKMGQSQVVSKHLYRVKVNMYRIYDLLINNIFGYIIIKWMSISLLGKKVLEKTSKQRN